MADGNHGMRISVGEKANMQKAMFYSRIGSAVVCGLCAHACRIEDGQRGRCGVRLNSNGELYSLVYERIVAEHVDPIEKKPFFHVLPHSASYSIATLGCNFHCRHCQNSTISQVKVAAEKLLAIPRRTAVEIVAAARAAGCQSISYTYVEPTIFFEFAYRCSELAVASGLKNLFVSNGFMSAAASRQLAPLLTAINIDIKSFRDDFYQQICGARLLPVLETVQRLKELGVWVEITTLVIPGLNDTTTELNQIADFLVGLDPAIPWHVTAFYPAYQLKSPPATSRASLAKARQIGLDAGLQHVYAGNQPGGGGEDTCCPVCGAVLIRRQGFAVLANSLVDGCCPACTAPLAGIWR